MGKRLRYVGGGDDMRGAMWWMFVCRKVGSRRFIKVARGQRDAGFLQCGVFCPARGRDFAA